LHDRGWARRILNGDKVAGERLVAENYPRIYRMLRCLTGCVEVAEDLTQQTFVHAWTALATYRGEAKLGTWLHRIAYHEYTHWLRARRDDVPLEAIADLPDLRAVQGLKTVMLSRALQQLSDEHRETFLLYYVQELSVSEVAAVLDLPPGTVKSRLFTARKLLRNLLSDAAPGAGASNAKEQETASDGSTSRLFGPKEVVSHELSASHAKREAG
jgi:RNA polymerase sigma-70 factor (ECF subfamily)